MYEISSFLRRISSHLPICDTSDIRCVAYENVKLTAVVRPMFTAIRRVTVTSKIRDREVNLRIKLYISYIDQLIVPGIFNYSIRAKNVDRWPGMAGASGAVARAPRRSHHVTTWITPRQPHANRPFPIGEIVGDLSPF